MFAKYRSVIYESLMVILGCAIFGAGLDAFVLPHKLVSTGISGVGLILYYVTGLSVGSWNMILNIPSGLLGSGWAPVLLSKPCMAH